MPTYEYVCDECGKTGELFCANPDNAPKEFVCAIWNRSLAEEPPVVSIHSCPGLMRRQIGHGAGCIFKGPGFHCNDYPKAGPPKEDK